ncbi:CLUMA_CG017544, isoform A [Clunio marinus]|uniref:Sugar transporter SWEET n=1 Tax=Clunio marinus TaxID=568069 RepID=A0A1J1IW73_9DIPT|nr:CLUMA_CG017544, isoform A [Clunio marinus]
MEFLENLSDSLSPYKDLVANIATTMTIAQLMTPILLINDIRKMKTTEGISIVPFLGGAVLCTLFLQFGQMIGDPVTVKVNIVGVLLSLFYLLAFYYYTPIKEKFSVWSKIGGAFIFSTGIILYTMYEDPTLVEMRFGMILTGLLYLVMAAPMADLKHVIRDKSTESLPFPIILMGFIVSFVWLIYGIILNSLFMVFQNIFAVLLTGFQLSFFAIYPSTPKVKDTKKKN